MYTSDYTIAKLRKAGILSENGLDLSVLVSGEGFGKHQNAITSFAVVWELAKRNNETYRSRTDGRYVFESKDAWMSEAKWFAQAIMREWSGNELSCLEPVDAPGLPDVNRVAKSDRGHQGQLNWMEKDAAYNIYLMVKFRIENGSLNDQRDIDPLIAWREALLKTPRNIERSKYRPFVTGAWHVRIAPTAIEDITPWVEGGAVSTEEGEDSTEDEEDSTTNGDESTDDSGTSGQTSEEPSDEDLDESTYVKYLQGQEFNWLSFLTANKQTSAEARAVSDGVDPDALVTHGPQIASRLAELQKVFPEVAVARIEGYAPKKSAHAASTEKELACKCGGHSKDMSASCSADHRLESASTREGVQSSSGGSTDGSPASSFSTAH